MIWIILTGIVVVLIYYTCIKPLSHWKNLGVKQSTPLPLLGDSWRLVLRKVSFCEFVEWAYNTYPNSRYSGIYQFVLPILVPKDPDLLKEMFVKHFDHFTDRKQFIDPEVDPLWGRNLSALSGQKWREMRATMSGSFTSSKMKSMFHLIEDTAETFVQFFANKKEDVIDVELKDAFTRYTTDVVATTAFGIKCDSLAEPNNEFYLMGKAVTDFRGIKVVFKLFGYILMPKVFRLLKIRFFSEELVTFFKRLINDNIRTREENGIVRPDMINVLLEARKGIKQDENEAIETGYATVNESADLGKFKQNKNISNDDITGQALGFFFAGFDTISTGICFGSYELAMNIPVQEKLRNEIRETFNKVNGKITYEALLKMKYMDMVVSEILRKWPPAPSVDRVCTKPYTIEPVTPDEKPVSLKIGDAVWLPIQGIHRDPNNYPDPEKFDPERFSDENKDSIKPYTYMPFGLGPRNCIGSRYALLGVKALLFNLLLNFEIIPIKRTQIPIKLDRSTFLHTAEGGFWFGLKHVKN